MSKVSFKEIKEFYGTSLSTIYSCDHIVIKKYDGNIHRGFQKLENENKWLTSIPKSIHDKFPLTIPKVLKVINEIPDLFELHIEYINRKSLTKEILKNQINSKKTIAFLNSALSLLVNDIYPLRSAYSNGEAIFQTYHYSRYQFSNHHLRKVSWIKKVLNSEKIVINGIVCPSFGLVIKHINDNSKYFFKNSHLVAFHGNLHLDNILIDNSNKQSTLFSLIDPRGELLGPSHYDFSKLLLTFEGHYDEINYGGFYISKLNCEEGFELDFELNTEKDIIYKDCFSTLMDKIELFSKTENISKEQFYITSLASQWIHVFSFLFYHYNKEPNNKDKIYTFLGILALLGKRLITETLNQKDSVNISRLNIHI